MVSEMELQNDSLVTIKAISLSLLGCGILLLFLGVKELESLSIDFSRFNGSMVDIAVWMFVGGVIETMLGLGGLLIVSRDGRE